MRGWLGIALAGGALVTGGVWAPVQADSNCASGSSAPASAGAHGGGAQVCVNGGAVRGTVTATGGYVVADGASSNPEPLDGYIGYSSADGGPVACASGEYNPAGGNNPVSPSVGGPCAPQLGV